MILIILSLGRGHLLQVPPGAGEEPSEVQQPDEEQAVVLRVRHLRTVLVLLQEPSREHRAHCENHDIFYVGPMSIFIYSGTCTPSTKQRDTDIVYLT